MANPSPNPLKLNQISCSKCKERKVKCDRIAPRCSRCEGRGVQCVYPRRKGRPVRRLGKDGSTGNSNTLATILDRLQRVENKCVTFLPQRQPPGDSSDDAIQPSTATALPFEAASNPLGSISPWPLDTPPFQGDFDAASTLQSAIDEVEKRVHCQAAKSVVRDAIHIPKELARTWVELFFHHMHSNMFVNLLDRRLIELIPELLEMDNVYLDGSITFIYYIVLYFGCSIAAASTPDSADIHIQYCKAVYICCLRALPGWQREATGSTTDLIAVLFMVMICAESLNSELGWQMYNLACEYVQRLNLQCLDVYAGSSSIGSEGISDGDRKSFWELLQIDLFIQFVFDKPPRSITATTWKVNMPWLNANSQPQEKVEAMLFLCGSRITLVLMRFFSMLEEMAGDDTDSRGELMQETEALCQEIQELYTQEQLGTSLVGSAQSETDKWKAVDINMIGYTCIIFMLRRARMHALNSPGDSDQEEDLLDSPVALDAARNIIKTSQSLLTRYPWPTSVAALFGAFQIQIAYTMLFNAVRRRAPGRISDIRMLRSLGESIIRISSAEKEFAPLVHALRALDSDLKQT